MKRIVPATALAALIALLLPATPSFATDYQPDVYIKHYRNDSFHGRNVYTPSDPLSMQTAKTVIGMGETGIFKTKLQNDGVVDAADYVMFGCGGNRRFGVRYAEPDGTNVTMKVKNGTYQAPVKDIDEISNLLFIGIKAKSRADHGDMFRCKLKATSEVDPTYVDKVRAQVRVG
ncbi:MAG: hypothetical protein WD757_07360 [Actinomycetota bacterium]